MQIQTAEKLRIDVGTVRQIENSSITEFGGREKGDCEMECSVVEKRRFHEFTAQGKPFQIEMGTQKEEIEIMGKDGCKQRNVASLIECARSFTSRNAIQNKENPVTGVMRAKAREERLSHLEEGAISSKNRTQFIFGEIGQWRRRCRIQNHTCVAISETGFRERSLIQRPVGRRDVIHKHIRVGWIGGHQRIHTPNGLLSCFVEFAYLDEGPHVYREGVL